MQETRYNVQMNVFTAYSAISIKINTVKTFINADKQTSLDYLDLTFHTFL